MAKIIWDAVGERRFEAGVDHGVLYFYDLETSEEVAVPWNGLTAIDEDATDTAIEPKYLDGVKYLNRRTPSEYSGKITAFTYPDEFDRFVGVAEANSGIDFHDQEVTETFGLSYRTRLGNDILSTNAGYRLHLLYNLTAMEDSKSYSTLSDAIEPSTFSWTITGIPEKFNGRRPTVHVSLNSTKLAPELLAEINDILYGTSTETARLPTVTEFSQWL